MLATVMMKIVLVATLLLSLTVNPSRAQLRKEDIRYGYVHLTNDNVEQHSLEEQTHDLSLKSGNELGTKESKSDGIVSRFLTFGWPFR
jgi:hypothetical protein